MSPVEQTNGEHQFQWFEQSASVCTTDATFLESTVRRSSFNLSIPHPLDFLMPSFDASLSISSIDPTSQNSATLLPDYSQVLVGTNGQTRESDLASGIWSMESFWDDALSPFADTIRNNRRAVHDQENSTENPRSREDEADRMSFLFDRQTCHALSIQEELDPNPWRTLIWPLAAEYPALWHALAALTCLCMSKQQPQLRDDATRHSHRSAQLLSHSIEEDELPKDVALAVTLALAFADTWDYENSPTGTNHIRNAGSLLSQLLSTQRQVVTKEAQARTEFLYNTWTYMDVLARFTCNETLPSYSENTPLPHWDELGWNTSNLDPLMGYALTFFPIMRRVADLINKVRARSTSGNSPAIISQGLQLRQVIEDWSPPIDLEMIEDPTPNMTDAIQTAEAYRWATLCLLYQAIPELPNLTSYGELAQKILVYLATTPLDSKTIIVHILPLMVAGCDAVEEEDREFVRERWSAMAKRMVAGIINRCLKITEEVWRRREEYLWTRGLSVSPHDLRLGSSTTTANDSAALSEDIANFINLGTNPGAAAPSSGGSTMQGSRASVRNANGFPISAAFKKGVDTLTRSGCSEYTVRGKLHWLGVMKDWDMAGKVHFRLVMFYG